MDHDPDELTRRLDALREDFDRLGEHTRQAGETMVADGLPPGEELLAELAAVRGRFLALQSDARDLADALLGAAPTSDTLPELRALLVTLADERAGQTRTLAVLDRVLALVHREQPDSEALAACRARAGDLRAGIAASRPHSAHPEAVALAEGTHPFAQLLALVDERERLTDERAAPLLEGVTAAFGSRLAAAAILGKLAVQGEPTPPAPAGRGASDPRTAPGDVDTQPAFVGPPAPTPASSRAAARPGLSRPAGTLRPGTLARLPAPTILREAGRALALPWRAIAYLLAIVFAEALTTWADLRWSAVAHVAILGNLLLDATSQRTPQWRGFALALAIAPVLRIVSLALPLHAFAPLWWPTLVGLPLCAAALALLRTIPLSADQVGLRPPSRPHWPLVASVALSGLALGAIQYALLRPPPLVGSPALGGVLLALVLLLGAGLLEEVLFRGILQATATEVLGIWPGIVYGSVLFGALSIGQHSAAQVVFASGVAWYFSVVVLRTRTLLGVALAHGLTNILAYIIFPLWRG